MRRFSQKLICYWRLQCATRLLLFALVSLARDFDLRWKNVLKPQIFNLKNTWQQRLKSLPLRTKVATMPSLALSSSCTKSSARSSRRARWNMRLNFRMRSWVRLSTWVYTRLTLQLGRTVAPLKERVMFKLHAASKRNTYFQILREKSSAVAVW